MEMFSSGGFYPERAQTAPSAADRLVAALGYRVHTRFARGPRDFLSTGEAVRAHQARFTRGVLAPRVPELRYQLRQGGLRAGLVAELLALAAAAIENVTQVPLESSVLGAARLMIEGKLVDLDDAQQRRQALVCTAISYAVSGAPVHVIAASDFLARHVAAFMREPLASLGFSVGCVTQSMAPVAKREAYAADVVCGAHREIALDYLRDRLAMGGHPGRIRSALARISGDAPAADKLMLRGLCYAIVDDADLILIDDARAPLVISAEADTTQERYLYEQAIELARALRKDVDFRLDEQAPELTAAGSGRLARLVQPLGGIWGGQQRRETLVVEAIAALHLLQSGLHYRIDNGRLSLSQPGPEENEYEAGAIELRKRLIEVKEGLPLSGRRDVLGRVSVPRFFGRYMHLCGICADASGLEGDLWSMYRLKAERATLPPPMPAVNVRMFSSQGAKEAALLAMVGSRAAAAEALVLAVRTPVYAARVMALLKDAGAPARLIQGTGDPGEQALLAAVHVPGSVTVTLYPAERNISLAGSSRVHLVIAELHDAHRHIGRLQRAYDAQSCELLLSLDEEALRAQINAFDFALLSLTTGADGELSVAGARYGYRLAQRRLERAHSHLRAEVLSFDQYLGDMLAFSGIRE